MDWLAGTVLSDYVGVPATKFNDDRLGRTLDALADHAQVIWQDIASQALMRYQIDLSVLFYDLTALVMTGEYPDSELVDYGFAHNTPSDKQKVNWGWWSRATVESRACSNPGPGAPPTAPRCIRTWRPCRPC